MMRGRQSMAVAVRHPSGDVVVHSEPLNARLYGSVWAKRPFIRGVLMLWDTLALGMKALVFSANVALEEEDEEKKPLPLVAPHAGTPAAGTAGEGLRGEAGGDSMGTEDRPHPNPLPLGEGISSQAPEVQPTPQQQADVAAKDAFQGGMMWGTMIFAMVFGVGLFFVTPLLLTRLVESRLPNNAAASVAVEGMIRIALFMGYVWLIGRLPDVRRVFAYHGAEHKTIHAYEAGVPLTPERVRPFSVAHPRCGTAFLLYVVVLSIFVFALVPRTSLPVRIATRITFVPLIASVAYEVIRFSGRKQHIPAVRALLLPGLALQSLTTREPDDSQVEVAIRALQRVIEVDGGSAIAGAPPGAAPAPVIV